MSAMKPNDAAVSQQPASTGRTPPRHPYGGPWTEVKLDAVDYFSHCYTKALKRVGFDLHYIDAFAGTGTREATRLTGGLFDGGAPVDVVTETLDGSARRALAVSPPYDHFTFIEQDAGRCAALDLLKAEFPDRDITVIRGDANTVLRDLVAKLPWSLKDRSRSRGVVFLDPYALQVEWKTLQALAGTRVLDVWYLFPIRDTLRQLAHNINGVGPKEPTLDRVLGPEWRELYKITPAEHQDSIFDYDPEPVMRRIVTGPQFERWLKARLEGEFSFVSEPLPIMRDGSRQTFSLFLCVSNPSKQATELAEKFVKGVTKKYGPRASRRKFGP